MATKKKLLQAAAGSASGGAGLNVEEVFINYLWEGNDATRTITNGIDLSNEGGMLWIKARTSGEVNWITDSERTLSEALSSNSTSIYSGYTNRVTSYTSSGFTLGAQPEVNALNEEFVSWCFRRAEGFFDVVTWTGDGTNPRNIAHNLGTTPGCFIVKCTSGTTDWRVYHRGLSSPELNNLFLHNTNAVSGTSHWSNTAPTDTHFTVSNHANVNASGSTYVAYLFAHNDGDGTFGPTGDQDIIKCGSYTGNNGQSHHVELGFEPQWLLVKNADLGTSGAWWSVVDVMRGMADNSIKVLKANTSDAEINENGFTPTATGFTVANNNDFQNNLTNNYIYIAIRRGPMAVPESATDVFAQDNRDGADQYDSGWPVDFTIQKNDVQTATADWIASARLQGNYFLRTHSTDTESANNMRWDTQDGLGYGVNINDQDDWAWMWKRAPSFCDVVAYTGDSVSGSAKSHNLGVAPEMIWVKNRNNANDWNVWHSALSATQSLRLNLTNAVENNSWFTTLPTDQYFYPNNYQGINQSGYNYIAYLFASVDGVSKVGSYTGNGSTQNIDCGFSNGARFILIKRTDSADGWFVHDTERGIVTGNDPYLQLNTTDAEAGGNDIVDPYSAGFTVNNFSGWNASGGSYIFYAIA